MSEFIKVNHFPSIFISSADSYSDLWELFFSLFKKNWPEYNGTIYLNTQEKTIQVDGLNIICTQVGHLGSFGKTFRAGLDQVNSESIMLIMIDYFFVDKVAHDKLNEYFKLFLRENLDSLCLTFQNYPNIVRTSHPEINTVCPPAPYIMFSYQIAFWKKEILREMALPHENPWTSEWYGSLRAQKMSIKLSSIAHERFNPIAYNLAGCLHKGKWLTDAVEYLSNNQYQVDFKKRGYYTSSPRTFLNRLKLKWMIIKDGLKGSYWDLCKRTAIN